MSGNILKIIVLTGITLLSKEVLNAAVSISFEGSTSSIIDIIPEKNTGLDHIFVCRNAQEISEMIISGIKNPGNTIIETFENMGGSYTTSVSYEISNGNILISNPKTEAGYIISSGDERTYIWVVDYAKYPLTLRQVTGEDSQNCDETALIIEGEGTPIHYYTINGQQKVLSRDIEISYQNLHWDNNNKCYIQTIDNDILDYLTPTVIIKPPFYCSTDVRVSGDKFLKQWGAEQSIISTVFRPNGIAAETDAVQTGSSDSDEPSNIISTGGDGLGGSAPASITFTAYITDGIIHNEWQMSEDAEFNDILYRFNQQDLDYTFEEEGTFYLRYIGSNSDGSCQTISDTYTVSIGSSDLRIPNAFSPNDDGINDVWKVGYRSLLEFKCWIFDRQGHEIYSFTDPSQGWDGKYKGKIVKPGVYYYVIQATGADGKKYKKGGDINILNHKIQQSGGSVE